MTYYLYVKTHRVTGLKYLGQTRKLDPYRYAGSGLRWTNHLKKHGFDFDTEILKECESIADIKKWGLHYSEMWNVSESPDWANLMPEAGGPGRQCAESRLKMSISRTGKKQSTDTVNKRIAHIIGKPSPLKGHHTHTPESKKKISEAVSKRHNVNSSEERSNIIKNTISSPETWTAERKAKISKALTGITRTENTRNKMALAKKALMDSLSATDRLKYGDTHRGKPWSDARRAAYLAAKEN